MYYEALCTTRHLEISYTRCRYEVPKPSKRKWAFSGTAQGDGTTQGYRMDSLSSTIYRVFGSGTHERKAKRTERRLAADTRKQEREIDVINAKIGNLRRDAKQPGADTRGIQTHTTMLEKQREALYKEMGRNSEARSLNHGAMASLTRAETTEVVADNVAFVSKAYPVSLVQKKAEKIKDARKEMEERDKVLEDVFAAEGEPHLSQREETLPEPPCEPPEPFVPSVPFVPSEPRDHPVAMEPPPPVRDIDDLERRFRRLQGLE